MKNSFLFLGILLFFNCQQPTARRPISSNNTQNLLTAYTQENKRLNTLENKKIKALITKDSTKTYQVSPHGFWFTYIHKTTENTPLPKTGDSVVFEYDIRNLKDQTIYSKEALGLKEYRIDKEDFIPAIQQGIKLMKLGETITFVIPYYSAFGIAGDGHKIGVYQSIKSTVTLIHIKQKNEH